MKVPPFTLVQLHYFAAAVECGSMTAASRELMVSQPAISTAIAQLEKALGVTLVLRHHAHGLACGYCSASASDSRTDETNCSWPGATRRARTAVRFPSPISSSVTPTARAY